jgi:hypothetical protein
LAAIPKSIIQNSPGLTPRMFVLHPVKHQRAVERGLVAQGNVGILISDFQQALANSSTLGFAQLWEFLNDFRCAHGEIITSVRKFVSESVAKTFSDEKQGNQRVGGRIDD